LSNIRFQSKSKNKNKNKNNKNNKNIAEKKKNQFNNINRDIRTWRWMIESTGSIVLPITYQPITSVSGSTFFTATSKHRENERKKYTNKKTEISNVSK
jgi:hypothetical protein